MSVETPRGLVARAFVIPPFAPPEGAGSGGTVAALMVAFDEDDGEDGGILMKQGFASVKRLFAAPLPGAHRVEGPDVWFSDLGPIERRPTYGAKRRKKERSLIPEEREDILDEPLQALRTLPNRRYYRLDDENLKKEKQGGYLGTHWSHGGSNH
ncbi:hypothetical protein Trydic_g22212 [Trypoxylus dichotomus]